MVKPNIDLQGRVKRLITGIVFILVTAYTWLTLEVNMLNGGFYMLVLIIPLFIAILSILESAFCHFVLKYKRSRTSIRLYAVSLVISIITTALLSII